MKVIENELITKSSYGPKWDKLREEYHSIKGYLSSSVIKDLRKCSWRTEKVSTTIGAVIHDIFLKLIYGIEVEIVEQKARKGTQVYKTQVSKLENQYGEEGFILCTPTDYAAIKSAVSQFGHLMSSVGVNEVHAEAMMFVPHAVLREKDVPLEFVDLHNWVINSGQGVKCAVDLLVKPLMGEELLIFDYKNTAKENKVDVFRQMHSLNYVFSLHFYRYVLYLGGIKTSPVVNFFFMNPGLPNGLRIQLNTNEFKELNGRLLDVAYVDLKANLDVIKDGGIMNVGLGDNGYLEEVK